MRKGLAGPSLAIAIALTSPAGAAAAVDYSTAPFTETTNGYAYGQAPVFMPSGNQITFGKDFKDGHGNQVWIADWPNGNNGSLKCLTCNLPTGASAPNTNGVPAVRPQGDWILFHSWRGHHFTIGSPGYGGLGSELWVMKPDGSHQTQLTGLDQSHGAGEGEDEYHAYWSPDGTQIVYAHLNWNFVNNSGNGKWDVRVADFNVDPTTGQPSLSHIRVVRPANGHWYETQWWNPDPTQPGFLYTESYPENSPSGGAAVIPQLFYCQLADSNGTPDRGGTMCKVTRLTDNASWDEQAIFTPDSQDVIFMSSRDRDGIFNTWANLTRTAGVPSDYDYLLILPIFEAGFLQPIGQEATDLYEINLATKAVRRLTYDGRGGWITPEFGWDPSNRCLVWTENRFPDGYRYQLPDFPAGWAQQLQALAANPPNPSNIVDVGQNGVGVAPLPVEQATRIGSFVGSTCGGPKPNRRRTR